MKLIDLMSLIPDSETVYVYEGLELVGVYDGKNSIEPEFNDCIVDRILTTSEVFEKSNGVMITYGITIMLKED